MDHVDQQAVNFTATPTTEFFQQGAATMVDSEVAVTILVVTLLVMALLACSGWVLYWLCCQQRPRKPPLSRTQSHQHSSYRHRGEVTVPAETTFDTISVGSRDHAAN